MQAEINADEKPFPIFIRLYQIAKDKDRASLSKLRKSLSESEGAQLSAFSVIGRYLPVKQNRWDEAKQILVAGLFALHLDMENPSLNFKGSLGLSFKELALENNQDASEGINRRFSQIIESDQEDLPLRLRHSISLLKNKGAGIDWPQLLKDLNGWGHPERYVQKQWARDFWSSKTNLNDSI